MPEPTTLAVIGHSIKTGFTKTKDLIAGATKKILEEHKKRFDNLEKQAKELSDAIGDIRGDLKAMNEKIDAIKEISKSTAERIEGLDRNINETRRELQGNIDGTRREVQGNIAEARIAITAEIERSNNELQRSIDRVVTLLGSSRPKLK